MSHSSGQWDASTAHWVLERLLFYRSRTDSECFLLSSVFLSKIWQCSIWQHEDGIHVLRIVEQWVQRSPGPWEPPWAGAAATSRLLVQTPYLLNSPSVYTNTISNWNKKWDRFSHSTYIYFVGHCAEHLDSDNEWVSQALDLMDWESQEANNKWTRQLLWC
jgi:hypothetical protein